jgi:hypothetical protein
MHILIAVIYGATLRLSLVAYALILGDGLGVALALAPFIVSGGAVAVLVADCAIRAACRAYAAIWGKIAR